MHAIVSASLWAVACAVVCAVVGGAAACAQPHYDDDIGVAGVAVADGALAGTFAKVSQAADENDVPGLGQQEGGGQTFTLVVRTWDGSTSTYAQTDRVCHVENFDVAGLHTDVSDDTAQSVPPFAVAYVVDHATGAVATEPYREIWALAGLDHDEAIPTSPDDPSVVDMDGDGKPGATLTASGLVEGELYVVQRKTLTLSGVTRSADEAFGLLTHKKEGAVVDATSPLLKASPNRKPWPDPKESWWHEQRIDDGAGCDDVDADAVSDLRPF